jgi:hypothetical protein
LGGQALVVDLRQSLGHHERDGVRHSEKFDSRQKFAESTPPDKAGAMGERGDLQRLVLARELEGSGELDGVCERY